MALEVIGAGFGRTGTLSLKVALETLGFSKCHHMQEVPGSSAQIDAWLARARGDDVAWEDVFAGFRSCCDWPSCNYWRELIERYPDAKVVLTVRDPDRWYDSANATIYPVSRDFPRILKLLVPRLRRLNEMIDATVWDGTFGGRFEDREYAQQVFAEHNEAVKAGVPPERLLVFEAKDGWAPLCEFLGVPVPDEPYPHLNDTESLKRNLRRMKFAARALAVVALVAVAALWLR